MGVFQHTYYMYILISSDLLKIVNHDEEYFIFMILFEPKSSP